MKPNKQFRTILLSVISLVVLTGLAYYLCINSSKYLALLKLSVTGVIILFFLALAFPLLNGLVNIYMFQCLGVRLSYREGFNIAATATLANQLPLPGGIVARGVYLKHKHNLSYTKYFSAALALFFSTVAVNGFFGIGVLLYWLLIKDETISPILLLGFALMASTAFMFWLPFSRIKIPGMVSSWIDNALTGWFLISQNRILLFKLLGIETIEMFLLALRYWVAFQMISQDITAGQAVLLSAASILTQLVSIAPGGLGVREAIVGGIAVILGFNLTISVAAVELDRIVSTLVIILLGWISTIALSKDISKMTAEIEE